MNGINDLTIALMALIGTRFLAVVVFLEFFFRRRESKYAVLAIAWMTYMAAPLCALLHYTAAGDIVHPLVGYFAAVGTFLLIAGVFLYYRAVSHTTLFAWILLLVTSLGLAVFLFPSASGHLAVLSQMMFLLILCVIAFFKRRWFVQSGGTSYYWLLAIILAALFHAFGFQFVYNDAALSIRFLFTGLVNIVLLIFFLHFEYNQSFFRLKYSDRQYRLLAEHIADVVWIFDPAAMTFSYISPSVEGLLGYSVDEMLTLPLDRLVHPSRPTRLFARLAERIRRFRADDCRATTYRDELELRCRDASLIWTDMSTRFILNNRGTIKVVGVSRDITERIRAEEQLKRYSDRLQEMVDERTRELECAQERLLRQEKLAVIGQLAGSVAHELRHPLGVLSNAAYFLRMSLVDADDTTKEYLAMMTGEVQKSDKIISDLLDFSQHQTGKKSAKAEATLAGLLDEVFLSHPPPDGIDIVRDFPPALPLVSVNPQQIIQVLTNLIVNAYQAMPEGGTLTVGSRQCAVSSENTPPGLLNTDNCVLFTVQDTGCGIAPEHLEQLFEPLFTTKPKGIGLGLAICKNLIEMNGGEIRVKSVQGQGSTFTLVFPIKRNENFSEQRR